MQPDLLYNILYIKHKLQIKIFGLLRFREAHIYWILWFQADHYSISLLSKPSSIVWRNTLGSFEPPTAESSNYFPDFWGHFHPSFQVWAYLRVRLHFRTSGVVWAWNLFWDNLSNDYSASGEILADFSRFSEELVVICDDLVSLRVAARKSPVEKIQRRARVKPGTTVHPETFNTFRVQK